MRPDEFGETTSCSLYYDTDNYRLIRKSIEKPEYKEKLRLSSYGFGKDKKEFLFCLLTALISGGIFSTLFVICIF